MRVCNALPELSDACAAHCCAALQLLGLEDPGWWQLAEAEDDGKPKPNSVEDWLAVLGRWAAEPTRRPGSMPAATLEYEDAEHGRVMLGRWLYSRKQEARGRAGSQAAQEASRALMPSIQEVSECSCLRVWAALPELRSACAATLLCCAAAAGPGGPGLVAAG